jgi:hypothetical protein
MVDLYIRCLSTYHDTHIIFANERVRETDNSFPTIVTHLEGEKYNTNLNRTFAVRDSTRLQETISESVDSNSLETDRRNYISIYYIASVKG